MRLSILALALVLAGAAGCTARAPAASPRSDSVSDLESKTVALVESEGDAAGAYCSGVWVARDAFLTAAHCVRLLELGDPLPYITRNDLRSDKVDMVGTIRLGRIDAVDPTHDLALIRATLPPEHASANLRLDPQVGDQTRTMGHPLGLWWSYSEGTVAGIRLLEMRGDTLWWLQTTAPTSPGNSGGGLFDSEGDLIGVCHGYFPRGQNVNLFVHPSYIDAFLKAYL